MPQQPSRTPKPATKTRGPKPTRMEPAQILDAAQEVFAQEGLKAASLRAIAKRAGCDPALIYYHFESKEAMFMALLDRSWPALVEDLARLADPADRRPTSHRIWEVLGAYRRHVGDCAGLRAIVRGELVRGAEGLQAHLAERLKATSASVWAILRQGVERGELRADLPVEISSFFLVKMYLEILDVVPIMAPRIVGRPAQESLRAAERAWFDTFWRGVSADPVAPAPALPDHP